MIKYILLTSENKIFRERMREKNRILILHGSLRKNYKV